MRAVEQLRQVVVELEMAPLRHQVAIPRVYMAFGDDGRPRDEYHAADATRLLDELGWWARVLRAGRDATAQAA
jgi:NAD(P)H-dependent FMN reductase